jgi:hypothetical protein
VLILKNFKSCVLEVFILQGLREHFAEVRIVKDLVTCDWWFVTGDWWKKEKQCGEWCGASNGSVEGRGRVDFNAEGTEFAEKEGSPHPPVFFVRVADKGLKLDAASRASTKDTRLRVEGLELNGERFRELNAETPRPGRGKRRTQRSEAGTDLGIEVGLAASLSFLPSLLRASRINIGNGSTDFDYCQGNGTIIYHSNVRRGSGVDGRGWREFCSLVRREKTVSREW